MKTIDTYEPKCGFIVVDGNRNVLPKLKDCKIYITGSDNKLFDAISESIAPIKDSDSFLNRYEVYMSCEANPAKESSLLTNAIEEAQASVFIPLYTPEKTIRYFLVANITAEEASSCIPMMVHDSETITRMCIEEVALAYAREDADGFVSQLSEDKTFRTSLPQSIINIIASAPIGMMPSPQRIRDVLHLKENATHQERISYINEIRDNLKEWLRLGNKEELTDVERQKMKEMNTKIALVFDGMSAMTLRQLLRSYATSAQVRIFNTFDPQVVAEQSKMKIVVEKCNSDDKKKKPQENSNEGKYRIVFKKGKRSALVHFNRRLSKALYFLYLIDRKRNDVVDTLDLDKYRETIIQLFEKTYVPNSNDKLTFQQIREEKNIGSILTGNYNDARTTVDEACEQLNEIPSPYFLYRQTHLFALPSNITIPEELIEVLNGV